MKKNKLRESRNKEITELKKDLDQVRHELLQARLGIATGKNKNVRLIGSLRKDTAQLETIVREKILTEGKHD